MATEEYDSMSAAIAAHQAGNLAEAEKHCQAALRDDPNNLTASLLLGVVLAKNGQNDEATKNLRKVEQADAKSFEALNWLSIVLRRTNEVEEAISFAERAVAVRPKESEGYNNLGQSYLAAQRFAEAEKALRTAVSFGPRMAILHHNHALSLTYLGRLDEAVLGFQRSLQLAPNSASSWMHLSQLMLSRAEPAYAAEYARRAVAIEPRSASAHALLGKALISSEKGDEGEVELRSALRLNPNDGIAHGMLGIRLQATGKWDEAKMHLERSIELAPNQGSAYLGLVQGKKVTEKDGPFLEKITSLIESHTLPDKEASNLSYALGKAYNDLGEYEKAMVNYDEANRLCFEFHLSKEPFNREVYGAAFDRTIEIFSKEFIERSAHLAQSSAKPIFIVGQMRSGTTLTEQIISSHPDVAGGGELSFWLLKGPTTFDLKLFDLVPEKAINLAKEYQAMLDEIGPNSQYVTDKMPQNIQVLGLIHVLFPNAPVIHIKRQPIDNCLSIYMTPYDLPVQFAYVKENIVFAHKQYLKLSEHWKEVLPPGRVLEISYEDLIENREHVTREMISYCGLEWNDACLSPEQNERTVNTPSVWQVRQPIYKTSVDRWKRYEPWLGAFRELLG